MSRTIVPYPDAEIQFVGEKAARQFMPEKISHRGYHIDKVVCDGIWGICKRYLHNGISHLETIWILICSMKERILSSLGRLRSIFTFRISTSSSKVFPFLSLFFPSFFTTLYRHCYQKFPALFRKLSSAKE